jgi:two-component system OmpR family response regulator
MAQVQAATKPRILVIDDSEIVLEAVRDMLEEGGYEVATLTSALLFPQTVRTFQPNLILLDLNMPALSGQRTFEIAKRLDVATMIPIVFHSDRPETELAAAVRSTGAAGFIRKTGDAEALLKQIAKWLPRK